MHAKRIRWGVAAAAAILAGSVSVGQSAQSSEASTSRVGGADRYETSAMVARHFAPGVNTVFVASGQDYPDALAVGPVAGKIQAPVLLTRKEGLPSVVAAEVARLDPQQIVIVGGHSAVSESVASALEPHATTVRRIAGANRYETAALISKAYFGAAQSAAFVASGEDFPDALSAAAAGGRIQAPVLLTRRDQLPTATDRELERLDAKRLMVLGGSAAISDPVLSQILENTVVRGSRVFGPDRYATSAAVSSRAFAKASTVYLASGLQFPDALSGAPLAAGDGAPILLVTDRTLTTQVCREVDRLNPSRVVALGGKGVISDSVLTYVARQCAGLTPPPTAPAPTQTPTSTPTVPVGGGDVPPDRVITCQDFRTQRQAQEFYDYWVGKGYGDFYRLDEDGDGTPCEALPRG